MKLPADVRRLLERRFANQHRAWLAQDGGRDTWPLVISLDIPSELSALKQIDAVRAWAETWQHWQGAGELRWTERRWRVLGTQSLPEFLVLHTATEVSAWAGQQERWIRAGRRHAVFSSHWPQLAMPLARHFDVLADYSDVDAARLKDVLSWLEVNPISGLYLRQLPIAGIDTKWIEPRQELLRDLLASIRRLAPDERVDFHELCGLRKAPSRLRIRILDPALRAYVRGLGDITAPVEELAALDLPAAHILIVENLQTGLALPDLPGAIAFMALGKSVDVLATIPWLRNIPATYWGDIDTHGFEILNRARGVLPQIRSILMDLPTLQAHEDLWGFESVPAVAVELPLLTPEEHTLYDGLKTHAWKHQLRLEQERISWPHVITALTAPK